MKYAIIVHAWEESSQSYFYPWLSSKLLEKEYIVHVPDLPDTSTPSAEIWTQIILDLCKEKSDEITLIGHSLGVTTILNVLSKHDCPLITKVIAVAGVTKFSSITIDKKPLESFFDALPKEWNWDILRSRCTNFNILHSDNDHAVVLQDAEQFAENVIGYLHVFNEDHFCKSQIPEILPFI